MKINADIKMSKRLKALLQVGAFVRRIYQRLGEAILKDWDQSSRSERYWRRGIVGSVEFKGGGRFPIRARHLPAIPDRLTVRTGRLIGAMRPIGAGYFGEVQVRDNGFDVLKGVRGIRYAAVHEFKNQGQRSYLRRALHWVIQYTLKKRFRQSVSRAMKEFR